MRYLVEEWYRTNKEDDWKIGAMHAERDLDRVQAAQRLWLTSPDRQTRVTLVED